MFRRVCSINSVVAARLEPQDPLAAPHDKADDAKPEDQENPYLRPHPRRKRFCSSDNIINTFAKPVTARRQRFFILAGKDQRFFGRRRDDRIITLNRRKTAVIRVLCGQRRRSEQQASSGKSAQTQSQGRHHTPHIRLCCGPVNARRTLG